MPANAARVLLVEDSGFFRRALTSNLEGVGFTVTGVTNGEDAIKTARKERFDVIILDLRMPKRDGLSALAELRSNEPNAHVVIVSANYVSDQFREARAMGAEDCIDKLDFLIRIPDLIAHYSGAAA